MCNRSWQMLFMICFLQLLYLENYHFCTTCISRFKIKKRQDAREQILNDSSRSTRAIQLNTQFIPQSTIPFRIKHPILDFMASDQLNLSKQIQQTMRYEMLSHSLFWDIEINANHINSVQKIMSVCNAVSYLPLFHKPYFYVDFGQSINSTC